jgi:hypothetical protein
LAHTAAIDPIAQEAVVLFNPRIDSWDVHFEWSANGLALRGKTPVGRATIALLEMNRRTMKDMRGFLLKIGIHPRQMP